MKPNSIDMRIELLAAARDALDHIEALQSWAGRAGGSGCVGGKASPGAYNAGSGSIAYVAPATRSIAAFKRLKDAVAQYDQPL